jgi:hypothetical protein
MRREAASIRGLPLFPWYLWSSELAGSTVVTPKALFEFLEHSAAIEPDKTAIIEPGQGSITYGELNALANLP